MTELHPRVLFLLGVFLFCIGIVCGVIGNNIFWVFGGIFLLFSYFEGVRHWWAWVVLCGFFGLGIFLWQSAEYSHEENWKKLISITEDFSGSYAIQGKVEKEQYNQDFSSVYRLKIDNIATKNGEHRWDTHSDAISIAIKVPSNLTIHLGDTIAFTGKLSPTLSRPFVGFEGYSWFHGLYGQSSLSTFRRIGNASPWWIEGLQSWWQAVMFHGFPKNTAWILLGITIGNTELISSDIKEDFMNSGITHILVVSGSNIAFVILMVMIVLRYFRAPRWISALFVIVFVLLYSLLAGFDPPIIRACFMGIIIFLAIENDKKVSSLAVLFGIAFVILIFSPLSLLYDAGFGLSFGATCGILLFGTSISSRLEQMGIWRFLSQTLGVTIAAMAGSLPVIIYYFWYIPVASFAANILIGWLLWWILIGGVLYLFLSTFLSSFFLYIFGWSVYIPTMWILLVANFLWDGYRITLPDAYRSMFTVFCLMLWCVLIIDHEKNRLDQNILDTK